MAKKPPRRGEPSSASERLNFWLITLGAIVAGMLVGNCLLWYRGML